MVQHDTNHFRLRRWFIITIRTLLTIQQLLGIAHLIDRLETRKINEFPIAYYHLRLLREYTLSDYVFWRELVIVVLVEIAAVYSSSKEAEL